MLVLGALYVLYFDFGQVHVESSPVEAPYVASASSPMMRSLLLCQQGRYTPPSLSLA
jgi:hypothetical protein